MQENSGLMLMAGPRQGARAGTGWGGGREEGGANMGVDEGGRGGRLVRERGQGR